MGQETDTPVCEKCGGRMALMSGTWYADADSEPYNNGVEEEYEGGDVEASVTGYVCDDCGHIQGLWYEGR